MRSITISELENQHFQLAQAEHQSALSAGDTVATGRALDEIEGFALHSRRRIMRRNAGAMLDQHRPGWREILKQGARQACDSCYSERDARGGVEVRMTIPVSSASAAFRAFSGPWEARAAGT